MPKVHFVIILAALSVGCIAAAPHRSSRSPATRPTTSPATQPAALMATVDKAIKLLEAQKHEDVIRLLIEPKELERWLQSHKIESVVEGFKGRKADDLLLILRQARDRTPVVDQDGKRATFKLDGAVRKDVDFAKVGDRWYLEGSVTPTTAAPRRPNGRRRNPYNSRNSRAPAVEAQASSGIIPPF